MDNNKAIIKFCRELKCCDSCCLRYVGIRHPDAYGDSSKYIQKYEDSNDTLPKISEKLIVNEESQVNTPGKLTENEVNKGNTPLKRTENEVNKGNTPLKRTENEVNKGNTPLKRTENEVNKGNTPLKRTENEVAAADNDEKSESPPAKRQKLNDHEVCVSCLGILQPFTWPQYCGVVAEVLNKKQYDCDSFGFGLSAPLACLFREKIVALKIKESFPEYDTNTVTPLKEAGKWSLGVAVSKHIHKSLESGHTAALLLTLQMQYQHEAKELEVLKQVSPDTFDQRSKNRRRFTTEFSRSSVESALSGLGDPALASLSCQFVNTAAVECGAAVATRTPVYLGGRYIKLSRTLPQTPWLVAGKRMMDSSVQETIFGPLASAYGLTPEETENNLKFISAGREDVDVRCLGDGRPFAVEISDAVRILTETELEDICKEISKSGTVIVKKLMNVTKEDLTELKKGEETKCKTYEALCIKLTHSEYDEITDPSTPITVSDKDIALINSFRNTPLTVDAPLLLSQKTPIRVLHRRPLLVRPRKIYEIQAEKVEGHPQLVKVLVLASAGCYIKEWVSGELGRTRPALGASCGAALDILALDVRSVHLAWPR